MSALTQEQFEQLPEFAQKEYVETDGGYQHGGFVKLKSSLDDLDNKYKSTETQLSELQKQQQEAIAEAEKKAYEKAKADGNIDEVEKRYQQQLEDAQKRIGETEKQYQERLETLTNNIKTEKVNAMVSDLASKHSTEAGRESMKMLLKQMVDFDPESSKPIFKDLTGSATSLDQAGFEQELINNPVFAPLLKADVTTKGGGDVNGNTNGSADGKIVKRSQFDQMTPKARQEFFKSGGKVED